MESPTQLEPAPSPRSRDIFRIWLYCVAAAILTPFLTRACAYALDCRSPRPCGTITGFATLGGIAIAAAIFLLSTLCLITRLIVIRREAKVLPPEGICS